MLVLILVDHLLGILSTEPTVGRKPMEKNKLRDCLYVQSNYIIVVPVS